MAASSSELKDLENKLASGEYVLKDGFGKSDIWTRFKQIIHKDSGKCTGYVQCVKCANVYSYDSCKTGSSHLKRHNCSKKFSPKLDNFLKPVKRSVDRNDKRTVLDAAIQMCCKDLRPFDIISGEGFVNFSQVLVNMGAKYGNLEVNEILPHATTISRHIFETADSMRKELVPVLTKKMEEGVCAASTDMWTDDYKKIAYTSVTMHYFDDDWNLISKLLFTCDFPDERKTGINIRKELNNRFSKLGFPNDCLEKITFVTDRGANMINALEPYKRLDCIAHILNTVLRNLFKTDNLAESNNTVVLETLIGAKSLVTYLKQSGLVNRLTKTVHQDSETRWNSKLQMLISVHEMHNEITELLMKREESNRIDNINMNVLCELITFLTPFKEASLALEKEKEITLPYVLLWYKKLLHGCEINAGEEYFITDLKCRAKEILKDKFILRDEHKIATFLCPQFRRLKMMDASEKEDLMNKIKNLITETENKDNTSESVSSSPASVSEHVIKRKKIDSDFSEWQDDDESKNSELDIYLSLKSPSNAKELNVWWKNHEFQLKSLLKLAQKFLCIPATSASCERNFSAAGYLINERRTRLNSENIDASLFLHSNL